MAIIIGTELDTSGAKEGTAALQTGLKQDIGGALAQVQAKADEAGKSLKGMLDLSKIQAAAGAFGALKSVLDNAGQSVFGLSEKTQKAASSALDMATQGIAIGASFGPIPALIGGVVGGLIGYTSATNDATEATKKLTLAEQDRREKLRLAVIDTAEALKRLAGVASGDEFGVSGKSFAQLEQGARNAGLAMKEAGRKAGEAAAEYKALEKSGGATEAQLADLKATLSVLTNQYTEAERKQSAYSAAVDQANKDMEATSEVTAVVTTKVKTHSDAVKASTDAINARVAAINAETAAMLERRAVADEAAADRAEDGTGLDTVGFGEIRAEATEVSAALLEISTLPDIELPTLKIDALSEALFTLKTKAKEVGAALREALVEQGVNAAATLFENIEAGKKPLEGLGQAFEKLAAEQLKALGKVLIGEGLQNELTAARLLILSAGTNPQGYALAAIGGAEIAAGLAMGAGGALLGRRANPAPAGGPSSADAGTDSLGSQESAASGTRDLRPIYISFNSTVPPTERGAQEQAALVQDTLRRKR